MLSEKLMERVSQHTTNTEETLTSFYTRALINQLESEGDYEIRDIVEAEAERDKER